MQCTSGYPYHKNFAESNRPGITLTTSASRQFLLKTIKASFPLTDPDDLPSYLSDDLAKQLLSYAETCIHRNLAETSEDRVFLDDLAGVVILPDACLRWVHRSYTTARLI
jgi:hypothetical protein